MQAVARRGRAEHRHPAYVVAVPAKKLRWVWLRLRCILAVDGALGVLLEAAHLP